MLKRLIHRTAWRLETVLDRIVGQRDKRKIIEPYIGYATPENIVVRGRVLTALRRAKPKPTQSKWTNFKQMFALFLTDEVANVEVTAEGIMERSDDEGYFTLLLPRNDRFGWVDVSVTIAGQDVLTVCPVMIPRGDAIYAVVSDIDDTMLQTGAYSLAKNLWTSFTGNAASRHIFPDAVRFMNTLSDEGQNPVYYVSSSPWNLHHFLTQIFDRAGLVKGPKFLRDLGISENQFIKSTHGDHKGASIDAIVSANPRLSFILVGDTGQHDAFVYRDAIKRHPKRIVAVVLREPGLGPDEENKAVMQAIRESGVRLYHGPDFDGFAIDIRRRQQNSSTVTHERTVLR